MLIKRRKWEIMTVKVLNIDGKVYLGMQHRDIDGMRSINYYENVSKEEAILLIYELKKEFGVTCEKLGE